MMGMKMVDIFALIIVCSLDCVTIKDRVEEYLTMEECEADIPNLQEFYATARVTCHKGDILDELQVEIPGMEV